MFPPWWAEEETRKGLNKFGQTFNHVSKMNGAPLHSCLILFNKLATSKSKQQVKKHMYSFDQLLPLLFGDDNWLLFIKILSTYTGRKSLTESQKYFKSLFPETVCEEPPQMNSHEETMMNTNVFQVNAY